MNTRILKILRCTLCLVLILGMLPLAALADTGNLGTGTPDGTPPVLTGLTLSATTVAAPGEIEITAVATDDVSGVRRIWVYFYCQETEKELYCSMSPTYWDSELGEEVPYPDGKLHGTLEIDQYVVAGTFDLRSVDVCDIAGNYRYYRADYNPEWASRNDAPIPEAVTQRSFQVVDPTSADGTPPVLTEFTLSATTVAAPGEIEITAVATDDVSGVHRIWAYFYCQETGKYLNCLISPTYWDSELGEEVPYPDGKLHGTLEIDQYVVARTFDLRSVEVCDIAGNYRYYLADYNPEWAGTNDAPIPEAVSQRSFQVSNSGTPDGTAPVLTGLSMATVTIAAPGEVEITAIATDDVSGVHRIWVYFYCQETEKELYCSMSPTYWDSELGEEVPYPDGKLHGTLEIDQYVVAGTFDLRSVEVYDIAGNYRYYQADYNPEWAGMNDAPIPEAVYQRFINVLNAVPDVTTSVAKSEFVDQIKNAENDAYIVADYTGNTTLSEDAFSAIAGTDKTLDLVSEGVTWRFNGQDIVNDVKPIGLNVTIKPVEEHPSEAAKDIQAAMNNQAAVVMQFPENGQLPGKATIQIKVDYAMREYLGSDRNLCVYYYNNETGELELVAKDLVVINDTFVEFPITHCSNYVLTAGEADFRFTDVPNGIWYLNPVYWAIENNITSGITNNTFVPNGTCTRAQIVTFLWRSCGSPKAASATNPFTDVPADAWYADAVLWAVEKGITTGTSATTFSPDAGCTRGQVATFLWRSCGQPVSGGNNIFTDIVPGTYYYNAVLWAVEKGITNGVGEGTFAPDATCTRGQIVTFLYRAMA